jgi:hypothetical protein
VLADGPAAEADDGTGRWLWETLKRELGDGWLVVYFENGRVLEPDTTSEVNEP